ncbi:MAG TPA: DUF2167 domain-containing protein [Burkholderiales bacterium]|nr:DUF2167 domain-containing protein [Burkholderiales bacterium]
MALLRVVLASVLLLPCIAQAQRDPNQILQELQTLGWQKGPGEGVVAGKAKLTIPEGYAFLDDKNTRRFLEIMGNPPRDGHYLIAPANLDWFAVFSFDPVGYVKDDEKIDADALLKSLKESDGPGNEERKRLGMRAVYTDGWHVPPHYDASTKRLEWGVRLRNEQGRMNVNYTSRLLGRTGVMSAVLVCSIQALDADVKAFNAMLAGYEFNPGERYAEFKSGDKVAEYGLAALVLGGAAAAAAKAGWLKFLGKFWVAIVAALAAAWGFVKRLFFGRKETPPPGPGQT